MKRFVGFLAGGALSTVLLLAGSARAQSSGNFSATNTGGSCMIGAGGALSGGTMLSSIDTNISTSNGNGVTLDIRPSLVTGLFTDTKISPAYRQLQPR